MGASHPSPSRRLLVETGALLAMTLLGPVIWPELKTPFVLLPLVYVFVERLMRRRSWAELGFRPKAIVRDVAANWPLIVLVGIVIQFLVVWTARTWAPAYLDHVLARLPFTLEQVVGLLPLLMLAALGEEISYRALFQARLSWFIPTPVAIGLVSVAFGLAHWAAGDPVIVATDIGLIIVDSVIYGIIFARTHNVFVAWIAHLLANLFALGLMLTL